MIIVPSPRACSSPSPRGVFGGFYVLFFLRKAPGATFLLFQLHFGAKKLLLDAADSSHLRLRKGRKTPQNRPLPPKTNLPKKRNEIDSYFSAFPKSGGFLLKSLPESPERVLSADWPFLVKSSFFFFFPFPRLFLTGFFLPFFPAFCCFPEGEKHSRHPLPLSPPPPKKPKHFFDHFCPFFFITGPSRATPLG